MARPVGVAYFFAAVMLAVSLYCIARLAVAQRLHRSNHNDVTVSHFVMGIAMVGMLVPRWNALDPAVWELVFGVMALYFLFRTVGAVARGRNGTGGDHPHALSHHLVHMVMAGAMLYMYGIGMPIRGPLHGAGMSRPPAGASDPILTFLFVLVLLASAVWQLDGIDQVTADGAGPTVPGPTQPATVPLEEAIPSATPWIAPRLEVGCHIAMAVTMAYMLVLMV